MSLKRPQTCSIKSLTTTMLLMTLYYVTTVKLLRGRGHATQKLLFTKILAKPQTKKVYFQNELQHPSEFSANPLIRLDPERFLFPVLYNGPTNQMVGLRESVFLAILLNRTLIMPVFRKHFADTSGPLQLIDPAMRIDIGAMTSLITSLPHSALWEMCGNHMDVAFRGREQEKEQFQVTSGNLERNNVTMTRRGGKYNVIKAARGVVTSSKKLSVHYASKGRCAMFYCPFTSVIEKGSPHGIKAAKALLASGKVPLVASTKHSTLYALSYLSVRKPRFIYDLTREFQRDVIGSETYLAIHWRFDPNDWLRKCRMGPGDVMCAQIYNVTGRDVAEVAANKLDALERDPVLYFATPLNHEAFMLQVVDAVNVMNQRRKKSRRIRIHTFPELRDFLRRRERTADMERYEDDVLASVEMQICAFAGAFMYSVRSSWSGEVNQQRSTLGVQEHDGDILRETSEAHLRWAG